jgi:hypothetical protein
MKYDILVTLEYQYNDLFGLDAVKFGKRISTFRENMFLKMKTTGLSE